MPNLAIRDCDTWKSHFENLYKEISPNILKLEQSKIKEKLQILESTIKTNQNPLDYQISMKELEDQIKKLKSRKACGHDSIRTEMLKHSTPELQLALLKLFNLVAFLRTGAGGLFPQYTRVETN